MFSCGVFRKVFDEGRLERRTYIFARKMESLGTSLSNASHQRLIMVAIVVSHVYSFSFVNMMFLIIGFCSHEDGRSSYDCGDVSVTTARLARSKNCYKKARKWIVLTYIWGKLSSYMKHFLLAR